MSHKKSVNTCNHREEIYKYYLLFWGHTVDINMEKKFDLNFSSHHKESLHLIKLDQNKYHKTCDSKYLWWYLILIMKYIFWSNEFTNPRNHVSWEVEISRCLHACSLLRGLQWKFLDLQLQNVEKGFSNFTANTCLSSFGEPSSVDIWLIVQKGFIDCKYSKFS